MLGLVIFLGDLCFVVYLAVLVVALVTLIFYVVTTLLPLWTPFCPYNTPLSSPRLWGYFYRQCVRMWVHLPYTTLPPAYHLSPETGLHKIFTPCRQQEIDISTKTTPDEYTGHALKWLIKHSRGIGSREQAIQAIAGVESGETLLPLLEEKQILLQVAQSFTACFTETPGSDPALTVKLCKEKKIDTVVLHGQALTVLTNYTNNTLDLLPTDNQPDPFDGRTLEAVTHRFYL